MLGTTPEDLAQFLHQEERLDSVSHAVHSISQLKPSVDNKTLKIIELPTRRDGGQTTQLISDEVYLLQDYSTQRNPRVDQMIAIFSENTREVTVRQIATVFVVRM